MLQTFNGNKISVNADSESLGEWGRGSVLCVSNSSQRTPSWPVSLGKQGAHGIGSAGRSPYTVGVESRRERSLSPRECKQHQGGCWFRLLETRWLDLTDTSQQLLGRTACAWRAGSSVEVSVSFREDFLESDDDADEKDASFLSNINGYSRLRQTFPKPLALTPQSPSSNLARVSLVMMRLGNAGFHSSKHSLIAYLQIPQCSYAAYCSFKLVLK